MSDGFIEDDELRNSDQEVSKYCLEILENLVKDWDGDATMSINILTNCLAMVIADSSEADYAKLVAVLQSSAQGLSEAAVLRFNFLLKTDPEFGKEPASDVLSRLKAASDTVN